MAGSPRTRVHAVLAATWVVGALALAVATGDQSFGAVLLAVAPVLAAVSGEVRSTAVIAVLAVVAGVPVAVLDEHSWASGTVRVASIAAVGSLAVALAERRRRHEAVLREARPSARLYRLSAALSSAATPDEVADAVVTWTPTVLGNEQTSISLVEDGARRRLRVAGVTVLPAQHPLSLDTPTTRALARDATVVVPDAAALRASFPGLADLLAAIGVEAVVALPLRTSSRPLGALTMGFDHAIDWDDADLALAEQVGEQVSLALDRAELLAQAHADRIRAERLQSATAALATAATQAEVAAAVLEDAATALAVEGVSLYVPTPDGRALAVAGRSSGLAELPRLDIPLDAGFATGRAYLTRQAHWFDRAADWAAEYPRGAALLDRHTGASALLPLVVRGRALGVMVLRFLPDQELDVSFRRYVQVFVDLAAQALDRARLYEEQQDAADRLQRSLQPRPDRGVPALEVATRYVPASEVLDIGGDWFDLIRLGDTAVALTVGDVVGHGLEAAAGMGRLHSAVVSLSYSTADPAALLHELDVFARRTSETDCAATFFARLDTTTGVLDYSRAGMPPPLLIGPDGDVTFLDDGLGPPLGVSTGRPRPSASRRLEPGSTLVVYSDGLVDGPGRDLDASFAQLRAVAGARRGADPEELCARLADDVLGAARRGDDTVMLCVRLDPSLAESLHWAVPAAPESLRELRTVLGAWMARHGVGDEDDRSVVVLAANEAAANAVEHAYLGVAAGEGADEVAGEVALRAWIEGDEVVVQVADRGCWRGRTADERMDGGRGQVIMARVAEASTRTGAAGTVVELRRRLAGVAESDLRPVAP